MKFWRILTDFKNRKVIHTFTPLLHGHLQYALLHTICIFGLKQLFLFTRLQSDHCYIILQVQLVLTQKHQTSQQRNTGVDEGKSRNPCIWKKWKYVVFLLSGLLLRILVAKGQHTLVIWSYEPLVQQGWTNPHDTTNQHSKETENNRCLVHTCHDTLQGKKPSIIAHDQMSEQCNDPFLTVSSMGVANNNYCAADNKLCECSMYLLWTCKSFWLCEEVCKWHRNKQWNVWAKENFVPHSWGEKKNDEVIMEHDIEPADQRPKTINIIL